MLAFRTVVSVQLRELGDFSLYALKAGPAGGRLRRPSSTGSHALKRRVYRQDRGRRRRIKSEPGRLD